MRFRMRKGAFFTVPWKIALIAAFSAALFLHHRVFVLGEDAVQKHAQWFIERPLNFFPVENWLLPSTAAHLPDSSDPSPASREILFNRTSLISDSISGAFHNPGVAANVLFQYGELRPIGELELLSGRAMGVKLKSRQGVLWQGQLVGGQPVRLNLGRLTFDAEAFDLLSGQWVRFVELEAVSRHDQGGAECLPPVLRFARPYQNFSDFGRRLKVSDFAASGVSMLSGWSWVEPWGVWSDGPIAHILLYTGKEARSYEAVFRLHAYAPPEDSRRKVRLLVNNRRLDELEFYGDTGQRDLAYRFTTEPGEKFITFTFVIPNPVSPAMLSRGPDPRLLGVGLSGFKLNQLEE